MKNLSFIITILLTCLSCTNTNKNNSQEVKNIDTNNIQAEAIKHLQDSTIKSVYLGLKLGIDKDSIINFLTNLQKEEKIKKLQPISLKDDLDYRCTEIIYHNNSYEFFSKLNIMIDSTFYDFDTHCIIDFYKNKLYSIVITINPFFYPNIKSEDGWNEIEKIYKGNYGIGFTNKTTYEFPKSYIASISPWTHEISRLVSYTTYNTIWTTSNVQIILAKKEAKIKEDEYEKESFENVYNKYESTYYYNEKDFVRIIESKARLINSSYRYVNNYLIVYKDINLHAEYTNEINRIQQLAIKEKEKLKAEEKQKREIEDSIKQERLRKEYANQSI